jgi:hypothetical protein
MSGLPKLKQVWKNCVNLQVAHPLRYFKPSTLHEVISIIQDAERNNYKVKAVGSGHSFSDVALTRDYLIDTHGLNKVLPLSALSLNNTAAPYSLFLTECGILIHELNAALDSQNKALPNMGAYTGQTIIGAISTSTHGSGIKFGPLAFMVEAIVMVGEGGKVYHVERTNGISIAPIRLPDTEAELIQDDEVFLSAVVSLGCLGVIYAVVLRVCDSYLLKEVRTFCSWDEVKAKLQTGDILKDNRHLEVLVDPYKVDTSKEHSCLITARNICPPDVSTSWFRAHRAWLYTIIGWFIPDFLMNAVLRFFFNHFPGLTPSILRMSLKTLRDGCYIDKSFKVLDLGKANNISAYSTEIALPSNLYLQAVEALFVIFKKIADDGEQYITSPFSLRFVKTSDHYLAMQYGEDQNDFVCMIEFPVLKGTVGGEEILARIEGEMYKFGGIPHWGQFNHAGTGDETLTKLYRKFPLWLKIYGRFCPNGTFQNDFTERCRIVATPPVS